MLLRITLSILLVTATLALAAPPPVETVVLYPGQSLTIGAGDLTIGFDEVLADSRCPCDVWCFWEGDAAAQLWATTPGEDPLPFELHTHPDFGPAAVVGPYLITLHQLDPYPCIATPIDPSDYHVTLKITESTVDVPPVAWGTLKALYR